MDHERGDIDRTRHDSGTLARKVASAVSICSQLARALIGTERLDQIFEPALHALSAGLQVTRGSILLFDADGVMRFKAWRGLSAAYRKAVEGHTPWSPSSKKASTIVVPDVTQDAGLAPFLDTFRTEGIAGMAFVPLEGASGVIGKFMLYFDRPRELQNEEVELASLIAAQVAFAVERTQALRASQQLAAIIESSNDAIISKDLDGIIMSWNRGAERLFGYSEAEASGRPITLIVPPDRLAEESLVLSRIRTGEGIHMETVRVRKDGSLVPISLTISPVKDSDGRIVGASKIAHDISERKRAEAERAELHRRLGLLVSASASLLQLPEREPVRAATVALACELLGADACAVWSNSHGDSWRIVQSEGISETFANRVVTSYRDSSMLTAGIGERIATPIAVPDVGAHALLEEHAAAYLDEGVRSILVCPIRFGPGQTGTLVFYYRTPHVFSDADIETGQALANLASAALTTTGLLDEQRAQHAAAESARQRAAFLADTTALLSRTLNYQQTLTDLVRLAVPEIADWCVVDIVNENGTLERLAIAHADPEKLKIAQLLLERYPPDPNAPEGAYQVVRSGQPVVMESFPDGLVAARARDDGHRELLRALSLSSYICAPLVSARGILGTITLVFGESGRHYSTRDLPFAQDVAARASLAIDNAFAYRRVQDANRLKDEFLATLSHELRTPLNAVLGYADMLRMNVLGGDRYTNAIEVLTRNAKALGDIIDDLLDVSRITSGKLQLDMKPTSIEDVVKSAIATMQPAIDAKGVSLQLILARKLPQVSGDPDRLQQVVRNVLSNAVKFVARGGNVKVQVEQETASVAVSVADDGQGIDPAVMPFIFERFRQGDSRFSREHGGLGLGLAIVKELIELHGGTVRASSAGAGQGATFRIELPAVLQKESPATPRSQGAPAIHIVETRAPSE